MGFRHHVRFRCIVAAAITVAAIGGGVTAWRAKAGQEEELGLAARFLGIPSKALQLVPPGPTGQATSHSATTTQPPSAIARGRTFTVQYTSGASGSKPERVELVASEALDFVTEAYWVDGLNARATAGEGRMAQVDLQTKAQEFLEGHNPLPGALARLARVLPIPKDAPAMYMFEWELHGGQGKAPQGKALVTVSAATGRVVMYRYWPMDTSQFGKVAVSREKAVVIVRALFPALPAGTQLRLRYAELLDRSGWTELGRPVWQIGFTVEYPPGSRLLPADRFPPGAGPLPEPRAFGVDAITGKVVHNDLLNNPLPRVGAPAAP